MEVNEALMILPSYRKYIETGLDHRYDIIYRESFGNYWILRKQCNDYINELRCRLCGWHNVQNIGEICNICTHLTNSDDEDDGHLYLLWPHQYIVKKMPVFKIGRSKHLESRLTYYDEGSILIAAIYVRSYKELELDLIRAFNTKFTLYKGREYFKGDIKCMVNIFNDIAFCSYNEGIIDIYESDNCKEIYSMLDGLSIMDTGIPEIDRYLDTDLGIKLEPIELNFNFIGDESGTCFGKLSRCQKCDIPMEQQKTFCSDCSDSIRKKANYTRKVNSILKECAASHEGFIYIASPAKFITSEDIFEINSITDITAINTNKKRIHRAYFVRNLIAMEKIIHLTIQDVAVHRADIGKSCYAGEMKKIIKTVTSIVDRIVFENT